MPQISIIIPVFNAEKYLRRCIDSVLNQTLRDFELFLIDDGSTDSSSDICDEYQKQDNRIVVIHKKNNGQGEARNDALNEVVGEYIGFIDCDDWIHPQMYEYLLTVAKQYNSDIAELNFALVKNEMNELHFDIKQNVDVYEGIEILEKYLKSGLEHRISGYSVCTKIYKNELFHNVRFGAINFSEDYLINFRIMLQSKKIAHSDNVGYYYFQGGTSTIRKRLSKKDYGLIYNCKEVYKLALTTKDENVIYYSKIRIMRSNLSLLIKGMIYGISRDITLEEIRKLKEEIVNDFMVLFFSTIPLSRKIAMIFLTVVPASLIFRFGVKGGLKRFYE